MTDGKNITREGVGCQDSVLKTPTVLDDKRTTAVCKCAQGGKTKSIPEVPGKGRTEILLVRAPQRSKDFKSTVFATDMGRFPVSRCQVCHI